MVPRYVAFLRAINVGKRRYPMAELRDALTQAGCSAVATHIQTGNVVLTHPRRTTDAVTALLEATIAADRGFEVPTMVYRLEEFAEQVDTIRRRADLVAAQIQDAAREELTDLRHFVGLLAQEPEQQAAVALTKLEPKIPVAGPLAPRAEVVGRAVLLTLPRGSVATSELTGPQIEKVVGPTTFRALGVVETLRTKWA